MKKMLLLTIFKLVACGGSLPLNFSASDAQIKKPAFAAEQKAGYEVKITKNGSLLKTFKTAGEDALLALFVRDLLSIRLISPDQKQTVAIHLLGGKTGFYTLPKKEKPKSSFKAKNR